MLREGSVDSLAAGADAGRCCAGEVVARTIRTPASGALWLRSTKVRYRDELEWLYATRNLTIHTGQLSVYGDVQLASAASGLADLTLEFLGSWYATAADKKPAAVADSPEQIVRELAQRHSEVERHLGARHAR